MANNLTDLLLDGDPTACLVQDVFTSDITLATVRCAACGSIRGAGSLTLHAAPMGAVLRCAGCGETLMRAVRTPHGLWFEMTGGCYLRC
jgi:hypothetical protein